MLFCMSVFEAFRCVYGELYLRLLTKCSEVTRYPLPHKNVLPQLRPPNASIKSVYVCAHWKIWHAQKMACADAPPGVDEASYLCAPGLCKGALTEIRLKNTALKNESVFIFRWGAVIFLLNDSTLATDPHLPRSGGHSFLYIKQWKALPPVCACTVPSHRFMWGLSTSIAWTQQYMGIDLRLSVTGCVLELPPLWPFYFLLLGKPGVKSASCE